MENKVRNDYKIKCISQIFIGLLFLILGTAVKLNLLSINGNSKVLFGMSIIAFGSAIGFFINYYLIKKDAKSLEAMIVEESDERNIAIKNEAYAKTYGILKWLILYIFLAYTFMFPGEVFASFAWWSLMIICIFSLFLNLPIFIILRKNS